MKSLVFCGSTFEIVERNNIQNSFYYSDIEKVYIKFAKSSYDDLFKFLKIEGLLKYTFVVKYRNNEQIKIKIRPCERNVFKKYINLINRNCSKFN